MSILWLCVGAHPCSCVCLCMRVCVGGGSCVKARGYYRECSSVILLLFLRQGISLNLEPTRAEPWDLAVPGSLALGLQADRGVPGFCMVAGNPDSGPMTSMLLTELPPKPLGAVCFCFLSICSVGINCIVFILWKCILQRSNFFGFFGVCMWMCVMYTFVCIGTEARWRYQVPFSITLCLVLWDGVSADARAPVCIQQAPAILLFPPTLVLGCTGYMLFVQVLACEPSPHVWALCSNTTI